MAVLVGRKYLSSDCWPLRLPSVSLLHFAVGIQDPYMINSKSSNQRQIRELTSRLREGQYPLLCCRDDEPNIRLECEQFQQEQKFSVSVALPQTTFTQGKSGTTSVGRIFLYLQRRGPS